MNVWRYSLGSAGTLLGLFGAFRLLTEIPAPALIGLALWMIAAVLIHDGILSPLIIAIGSAITRIPPRARRYVQAALIAGALITVIAIPLIYRRGSQPRSKAILQQNYSANLTLLLTIIATTSLVAYALHVAADHRHRTAVQEQPTPPKLDPPTVPS